MFVVPSTAASLRPKNDIPSTLPSPLYRRLWNSRSNAGQLHGAILRNTPLVWHGGPIISVRSIQNIRRDNNVQVARLRWRRSKREREATSWIPLLWRTHCTVTHSLETLIWPTYLTSHGIRVNLTHVAAWIVQLYMRNVQLPRIVPIVGDWESWIQCHHVSVDGQNGFRVRLDPGHLWTIIWTWVLFAWAADQKISSLQLTRYSPKLSATQVKTTSRPCAAVIFSNGARNCGSTSAFWCWEWATVGHWTSEELEGFQSKVFEWTNKWIILTSHRECRRNIEENEEAENGHELQKGVVVGDWHGTKSI